MYLKIVNYILWYLDVLHFITFVRSKFYFYALLHTLFQDCCIDDTYACNKITRRRYGITWLFVIIFVCRNAVTDTYTHRKMSINLVEFFMTLFETWSSSIYSDVPRYMCRVFRIWTRREKRQREKIYVSYKAILCRCYFAYIYIYVLVRTHIYYIYERATYKLTECVIRDGIR